MSAPDRVHRPPLVLPPLADPAAALVELHRVHAIEQALLLREAARISGERTPIGRSHAVTTRRRQREGASRLAAWRRACSEEIACARSDGARVHAWLRTLSRHPIERWPSPVDLACESLRLRRSDDGTLALAAALTSQGRPERAIAVLRALLAKRPLEDVRREAVEALALASEAAGDVAASLGWWEAALAERRSAPTIAVALLCVALCAGDEARTRVAAARLSGLDLAVPGVARRFERALCAACERKRARGARPWQPERRARIARFADEEAAAVALVARAIL